MDLPQRDPLQAAVEIAERALPAVLEHVNIRAKIRRRAFLRLVREGFAEAQALELCWR